MIGKISGFNGAITTYAAAPWLGQKWGRTFPMGIFIINVSGGFLIGILTTQMAEVFVENPQWIKTMLGKLETRIPSLAQFIKTILKVKGS